MKRTSYRKPDGLTWWLAVRSTESVRWLPFTITAGERSSGGVRALNLIKC